MLQFEISTACIEIT